MNKAVDLLSLLHADGSVSAELKVDSLERLRKALVDEAVRPRSARRIWDTKQAGLFLRVMPSGAMSFNVQWSRRGAKSLGRYPTTTLDGARRQAQRALAQAGDAVDKIPDIARPKPVAETLTLEQFVDKHFRPHARKNQTSGDADADRILRVVGKIQKKPLADLDKKALQAILDKRDVEPATRARDRNTIRAALNLAVEWGMLDANPAIGLKTGRVKEGVTRFLSPDEERALLDALAARDRAMRDARARTIAGARAQHSHLAPIAADAYPDHLTPLVLVAMHTGCRRGELFKMRWVDVDLRGATPQITVRGAHAKSSKTRHIPLNTVASSALEQWRKQNPDARDVFGLVDVKKAWASVLTAAKVNDFRFHDLRHHFASRLVQRGVPLNTVRDLLGHADIKMTLRYAHLAPENKATAVALLEVPQAAANVTPIRRKA